MRRRLANAIAHRPIAPLAFVPHALQYRMTAIHKIHDDHAGFGGIRSVQTAGILLQRTFPGHWHPQDQGIKRRMVEAFPDQFSRGDDGGGSMSVLCKIAKDILDPRSRWQVNGAGKLARADDQVARCALWLGCPVPNGAALA